MNRPCSAREGARGSIAMGVLAAIVASVLLGCDGSTGRGGGTTGVVQSAGGATMPDAEVLAECPSCGDVLVTSSEDATAAGPVAVADAGVAPAVVGVVLVAMRVRPTPEARGADATVDLDLREDGTIYRRGALSARFEGERLIDAQGREVLRIAPDRVVMIAGRRTTHRLTDQGELRRADGKLLRVEDDGSVVMIAADGTRERATMRFEAFRPAGRATASMLLVLLALQP
ncbi:MAG: hypothetical protein JNK05_07225 [Myxococcales bacterium]|nr:hypothetical protein [Myxococcales bacterium]